MKEIFLQIYEAMNQMAQLLEFFHSDRPQGAIKNSMADLKTKIEALPDDDQPDLSPGEREAAEEAIGRCE